MYTQCLGVLLQGILSLLILDVIAEVPKNERSYIGKAVCLGFNLILWLGVGMSGHWWYMVGVLFDTIGYCIYLMFQKKQKFLVMLASVMGMNIINAFCSFIISILFTVLFSEDYIVQPHYSAILVSGYFMRVVPLYLLYRLAKKYKVNELFRQKRSCMAVIILGFLIQFVRFSGHALGEEGGHTVLYISLTILVMGFLVGVLWLVDWYRNQYEKRKMWEDNQQMSRQLHRSREIFPALQSALNTVRDTNDWEQLEHVIEEVEQLQQTQMREQEDAWEGFFKPTGILLLDEQIKVFGQEARQKNIVFNFYTGASMSEILKKEKIKKLDFLRLTGDLLRNTFQSVEKKNDDDARRVLLGMGLSEGILEVEIYDNGPDFPLHILEKFGERGNTEDGTGNGIPDILEFAGRYHATYQLTEYEDDSCFSKRISIIFDGKQEILIQSPRGEKVSRNSIFTAVLSE